MDHFQQLRILEAMLFASAEPIGEAVLAGRLPDGADVAGLIEELEGLYANRGVHLVRVGKNWAFRTAPDLAPHLRIETEVTRKLSRAAVETLAIIAYQQPITRAEIEEVRGVALSKGTLDILLEAGWIKPRGRRRAPGRPVTWGTTPAFLDHFGLEDLDALPGIEELKAAGLLDRRAGFGPLTLSPSEDDLAEEAEEAEEDEEEITADDLAGEFEGDTELEEDASADEDERV